MKGEQALHASREGQDLKSCQCLFRPSGFSCPTPHGICILATSSIHGVLDALARWIAL